MQEQSTKTAFAREEMGSGLSIDLFVCGARRGARGGVAGSRKRCQCAFKVLVQQLVKRMGWTVPVEDFPRPIVQEHLHPLDLCS